MRDHNEPYRNAPPFLLVYLRYLSLNKNYSDASCVTDLHHIREFLQFIHYNLIYQRTPELDEHKDIDISVMAIEEATSVAAADVELYLNFSEEVAKIRRSTIYKRLCILRRFYGYLCDNANDLGIDIRKNPFKTIRMASPSPSPVFLPQNDIDRLLSGITGENEVRDRAIILLFLTAATTLSELAALNIGDYHGNYLDIPGKMHRSAFLTSACQEAIEAYLMNYRTHYIQEDREDALFISRQNGQRLSHRAIQKAIRKHLDAAGLENKGYTILDLRDTAVKMILEAIYTEEERDHIARYLGYKPEYFGIRYRSALDQTTLRYGAILNNSALGRIGEKKKGDK